MQLLPVWQNKIATIARTPNDTSMLLACAAAVWAVAQNKLGVRTKTYSQRQQLRMHRECSAESCRPGVDDHIAFHVQPPVSEQTDRRDLYSRVLAKCLAE